jgi:hypothetical protein
MYTPASTADWMMLAGMLSLIGTAGALMHGWALHEAESEPEIVVRVHTMEDEEEVLPAA